jgi:hypothetical protein
MKCSCGVVFFISLLFVGGNQTAISQSLSSDSPQSSNLSNSSSTTSNETQFSAASLVSGPVVESNHEWRHRHFYQNLFEGVKASFGTRDIPLLAASFFIERQKPGNGVLLQPLELDYHISAQLARNDGKKSFGSIDPTYYPKLAATSRLVGALLLDAIGVQDYSPDTYTKLLCFHKALYYNLVLTHFDKRNFNRYRPDHSDTQSFFSGHVSSAFATSTFLYLEMSEFIDGWAYRHDGRLPLLSPREWKWLSFGFVYGWAGYVGYSRIHDRKHYLSDVLVGALSGSLVSYLMYPHEEKDHQTETHEAPKVQMGIQPIRDGAVLSIRLH